MKFRHRQVQKEDCIRPEKTAILKPGREALEPTNPAKTMTSDSQPLEQGKNKFLRFKLPICGTLLQQTWQTNIPIKLGMNNQRYFEGEGVLRGG